MVFIVLQSIFGWQAHNEARWPAGRAEYDAEQSLEGGQPVTILQFLLSIVLRQHGSPQSKPVTAAHGQTLE